MTTTVCRWARLRPLPSPPAVNGHTGTRAAAVGHTDIVRRNFVGAVTALVAGAALLTGCTSTTGSPLGKVPATGSATSTGTGLSPTSGDTGMTAPGTVSDRLPAAARAATPEGARAFVDFYVESINTAFGEPSVSALQGLSAPSCDVCAALLTRAAQFANSGQHYAGPIYRTRGSSASAEPSGQRVVVDIEQFGVATLDRDGKQIDRNQPSQARFAVSLEFTKAWRVTRWSEIPTSTA